MPEIDIKISDKNKFRKVVRRILFFCLTSFILFVIFSFVVFLLLNKYLKSERFKYSLQGRINNELNVNSNFDEFRWKGTTVDTDGLKAEGYDEAVFSKLKADGIRARINIGAVKRRVWEVTSLDINRINLLIDSNRLTNSVENKNDSQDAVLDSNDVERMFTLVGLDSFTQGMRSVPIIDGKFPNADSAVPQVMMDEGSMIFLNWNVGDIRNVSINGVQIDVEIVAVSNAELTRTMYFLRSDLSDIIGINATSIYLQLPNGVTVDSNLGEASVGIVERQTMLDGINDLLEQQSKAFDSVLFLGLLFTLVVMFNTMIMNIAERDFELATLRVLGASTWSIGTMLLFESILIGFIGGIVGVIFAFGGAVALASAFSSWQIFLPVSVDPGVALQIMGLSLIHI